MEGMRALLAAPDEMKRQALPRLLELAAGRREDVRLAAFQTLDALVFSDSRLAWGVAASSPDTCPRAVSLTKARWSTLDGDRREGLVQVFARSACPEATAWLWEVVEGSADALLAMPTLHLWVDHQRSVDDTARLIRLAKQEGVRRVRLDILCKLLAARDLDGALRYEAISLVHRATASIGARTVLGERLLARRPPLDDPTLLALVGGSTVPTALRKAAYLQLAGVPPRPTAAHVERLKAAVADPASAPDARAWFAGQLAGGRREGLFRLFRSVAQDTRAPRALRAAMLDWIIDGGGEQAAAVLATVVRQEMSHPETRAKAAAGFAKAWSPVAETTCVELCVRAPFGELCRVAIERLQGHRSPRLAKAQSFQVAARLRRAPDAAAVMSVAKATPEETMAALPSDVYAFALLLSGLAEADAVVAGKLGENHAQIDAAVCTMKTGWEAVNAAKAAGNTAKAHATQRRMYRADNLLREGDVGQRLASARRAAQAPVQTAARGAVGLNDTDLSARASELRGGDEWLRAPCIVLPMLERATRKERRATAAP